MLKQYVCDLHIHTCLSPCAGLEMSPCALVKRALEKKLDIIAVCDHNSSENTHYVMKAAAGTALRVLPGMEITTQEEAHLIAIFDEIEKLYALQKTVYDNLQGISNEKIFGCQVIANEFDEVEGFNKRLLFSSVQIGIKDLVTAIHNLNGIAIAAHIDRPCFSVISQLGFISEDIQFDAVEISSFDRVSETCRFFPALREKIFLASSDAHFLKDIGKTTTRMHLASPTKEEILLAFSETMGRGVNNSLTRS